MRDQIQRELDLTLRQITHLQRHIRLCRMAIRKALHEDTKQRASKDIERAKEEIDDLIIVRDRLRDELKNLDFVS